MGLTLLPPPGGGEGLGTISEEAVSRAGEEQRPEMDVTGEHEEGKSDTGTEEVNSNDSEAKLEMRNGTQDGEVAEREATHLRSDSEQTASSTEEDDRKVEEDAPEPLRATVEEMFQALVDAMESAPDIGQVEAWRSTLQELFTGICNTIPMQRDMLPAQRRMFPKLTGVEITGLLTLFEQVIVKGKGLYEDWVRLATVITKELLTTKWAFKEILRKLTSQHKWANAPVLNQWTKVTKQGSGETPVGPVGAKPANEDFMFNPGKFTVEEIIRLKDLCRLSVPSSNRYMIRDGTEDEWAVIAGIVEGNVACRRLPDFIRQVMKSEERLRLYSTIQAQVEGELFLLLDRNRSVKISRQRTKAITETILESAELARINLPALYLMLGQTKTISYGQVTKTIHFYFFTRDPAKRHKTVQVPYRGGVYRLQNAHQTERGNIWQRQHGGNGGRVGRRMGYAVQLHNLTRFNDIGRIAAFLRDRISVDFELDDLDTNTPNSRTSTVWSLAFKLAGSPTVLDGIVRILWFGTTIIVKHPNVGYRIQCLQCGNLGHTMVRCSFTDEELRGPGVIVVTESDIRELEDLARRFASLDGIKTTAVQRIRLQVEAEAHTTAAVLPPQHGGDSKTETTQPSRTERGKGSAPQAEQGTQYAHMQPELEPPAKHPWITTNLKGGRKLWAHENVLKAKSKPHSGAYQVLQDQSEEQKPEKDEDTHAQPEEVEVVDLTAEDRAEPCEIPEMPGDKERKKAALARGKPPMTKGPVLLTHKRQERRQFQKLIGSVSRPHVTWLPLGARADTEPRTIADVEYQMGIRSVNTPATGNCMAMALVQAVVNAALDGPERVLETLTARLKRGIKYTGLLNLQDQLAHDHRVNALVNTRRGWVGMSRTESADQWKWFLEDYAQSSSDRTVIVSDDTWGGSDTMGMAANFLQRDIYVVQVTDSLPPQWICRKFQPTAVTRNRKVVETAKEYPIRIMDLLDEVTEAKIEQPPIIVRYWGRHYSAFILSGQGTTLPDLQEGPTQLGVRVGIKNAGTGGTDDSVTSLTRAQSADEHSGDEIMKEPWDPEQWDGNVDELWDRLEGGSTHHELKK